MATPILLDDGLTADELIEAANESREISAETTRPTTTSRAIRQRSAFRPAFCH